MQSSALAVCLGVPYLKFLNQLINFYGSWYEHYLNKGHANAV